jgi:hypothetical protein
MATTLAKNLVSVGTKTIGNIIGNQVADTIFGGGKTSYGKRLHKIKDMTLPENEPIPNIYGKVQISGSIIWMSDVNEYTKVQKKRSKSGESTRAQYTYTVSIAIGLCEGPISSIGRIWADGVLINKKNIRSYYGTDNQMPDPLLEAWYDEDAPAFRGLAYVMIQEFDITQFGNKIPNFTFEIYKYETDEKSMESLVESMVIIPGCGEFVYDTEIHSENGGNGTVSVNQHCKPGVANAIVSLEQLRETFPNVEWVAPVVSWFATSLNAGECQIIPKVEKKNILFESEEWKVADIVRKDAEEVLRVGDKLNYGGTPSDASIVRYLEHIKAKGLETMFYPMIFVDTPGKPWRGRIAAETSEAVLEFFNGKNGYNKFILHYANLVKGCVSAFLIGSEMESLTKFKDENGRYIAVEELVKLATKVKGILGENVKVSYAANWGEYHSVNGEYYMDKLWASKDIDFVGIDAYFPLSNSTTSLYNIKDVINGWNSGELYDYYYDGNKQMPLSPQYAIKNIEFWCNNKHYNPDGKPTEWEPQMKKIWFTEYGFASISCATNEPNIFVDASTTESGLPKHSSGEADILAQRVAIEGTEMRWCNSEVVERRFLWTWDARPYPSWPQLRDVWSDCDSWQRGHWINGKSGVMELRKVVEDICVKSGVEKELIDVENLHGIVHGMVVDGNQSGKNVLLDLQKVYNFNLYEANGKITFTSQGFNANHKLSYDNFLTNEFGSEASFSGADVPLKVVVSNDEPEVVTLNYITQDFSVRTDEFSQDCNSRKRSISLNLPLVMSDDDARNVANNIFRNRGDSSTTYSFALPIDVIFNNGNNEMIQPGDVLSVAYQDEELIMRVQTIEISDNNSVKLFCSTYSKGSSYDLKLYFGSGVNNQKLYELVPESIVEVIKIPHQPVIAVAACGHSKKWYGCEVNYTIISSHEVVSQDTVKIDSPATIGRVTSFENNGKKNDFLLDNHSKLVIKLHCGQLFSTTKSNLFTRDKNMAIIGDEIIKFRDAKLQDDRTYLLTGLIRGLYGTVSDSFDRFVLLDDDLLKTTPIPSKSDEINLEAQTYLDKQGVSLSEAKSEKSFKIADRLLSPVYLKQNGDSLSWTPRIISNSNELFVSECDHSFCVRFLDNKSRIIKQIYTDNCSCKIPDIDVIGKVGIAALKNGEIKSNFAYLKL